MGTIYQVLEEFDAGELRFRVEFEGAGIIRKIIDVLNIRGRNTGKSFDYGKDIQSIEKTIDMSSLVTRAYGYGENDMTFGSVVWNTPSNPANKPSGQIWVMDVDATDIWGRYDGTVSRDGVFEDGRINNANTLLNRTWDYIQRNNRPFISYDMSIVDLEYITGLRHEGIRLGDTVNIIDRLFKHELRGTARIVEIKRVLSIPEKTEVVNGNVLPIIVIFKIERRIIMIKIVIDAGHGGSDSGAVGNGLMEKDITLPISLKVGEVLKRHKLDIFYTRTSDEYVSLTKRAEMANDLNADYFVSIHINSFKDSNANGVEVLYYPTSISGIELARSIQNKLIEIGFTDRGIKPRGDLTVLSKTKMTAVLVEAGFISNKDDINILKNKEDEIINLISKGILDFLDIKYIDTEDREKPSKWAEDDWNWGISNNITDGRRPKDYATREEVIAMIRRAKEVK